MVSNNLKIYISFLLILISSNIFSQRETDHWYFGSKAGLHFNKGNIDVLEDGKTEVLRGTSSISDSKGNLVFYTDGQTVWNKNHEIMTNGEGLLGDPENSQSSIIIPKPGSETTYYIFTTRKTEITTPSLKYPGIYFSEIEISSNYPLGRVKYKNMMRSHSIADKITAVHHENGKDIWVITFGSDSYQNTNNLLYAFKVTEDGVILNPIISQVPYLKIDDSFGGEMKASPDGNKVVLYNDGVIYLFNFDKNTGKLTRNKFTTIAEFGIGSYSSYGLSFSPNSKLLYYSATYASPTGGKYRIMQLPLEHPDEYYKGEPIFESELNRIAASINLGTDGKIYVAQTFYQSLYDDNNNYIGYELLPIETIGVINEPNEIPSKTKYQHDIIDLKSGSSYRGLPNFIQSYFRNRIVAKNECVTDTFSFSLDAYNEITDAEWDFGQGGGFTSTGLTSTHKYDTPGKYMVTCNVTINGKIIPFYKEVTVYPLPELTPNQELIQCANEGGVDYFDLFDISSKVVRETINKEFIFYRTLTDAENDENRIPNSDTFIIESSRQELFVRVISLEGCASITNFFIEAKSVSLGAIPEMFECDSSDNINGDKNGLFDLRTKIKQIKADFNLDETHKVRIYPSLIDAQTTNNLLPELFISPTTTVYVRVDNSTGCGGIEPIKLNVNSPTINLEESYTICHIPSQYPPIILDGNILNHRYEWRNATGNIISTSRNFTLNQTGTFSLTVYRTENEIECSNYKEFNVINPESATFNEINVDVTDSKNNTVYVRLLGNSNYEFSLDNETFFGSGLEYTFNNVNPGLRTVYVKDAQNCEPPVQTNVSVIGYLKFFTPNGDGDNDYWHVRGIDSNFFKSIKIAIFNRYGNLIHLITDFESQGWDGTYNGKQLPSNDYWFTSEIVDMEDNIIKESGSFSLIRK